MKIKHDSDYVERRAKEYPSVGDQLDAIWKLIAALPKKDVPPDAQQMLGRIDGVKQRLPKKAGKQ